MYAACRHIKSDGIRCQSPAMRRSDFCYFHAKLHTSARGALRRKLKFAAIEDTAGIRTAVVQTINALLSKNIDARQAGLILYGMQIVARKVTDNDRHMRRDTVRDISRSKQGDELAPELCIKEQGWGKSYEDCSECPHRETCSKFEDDEEDEEEQQDEASEEECNEPAEESLANYRTAARDEDRSPQTSGQRRVTTLKDANESNYNQVIESMSPIALLKTYLKFNPTSSPGS
jgi:hypothetical protein